MFDILMYLLAAAILIWLAVVGMGVLMLPVYLWLRWHDAAEADSIT